MRNLLLTIIMIFFSVQLYAQDKHEPVVVLELFTSQGCSSCPSADKLLKKVRDNGSLSQVIALSYHVDYWNYIGWKDPFSKTSFSDKQRHYAAKFERATIYTPQVVVNGEEHFVGSNDRIMNEKIKNYLSIPSKNSITISNIRNNVGIVNFDYTTQGNTDGKQLTAILVIKDRITNVSRGENRSRVLHNANIVVNEANFKLNKEGSASVVVPDIVELEDELSLVVLAKDTNLSITGASQVKL